MSWAPRIQKVKEFFTITIEDEEKTEPDHTGGGNVNGNVENGDGKHEENIAVEDLNGTSRATS